MRVVVPVKYVPDIQSSRRIDESGRVVRDLSEGSLNELDEVAIEAALRVVEAAAGSRDQHQVVAVTVGPADADLALRKAYQLGVDHGLRLTDDALAGSDYFATASALAALVRRTADQGQVDLVVTGMAALDGLGSVVPTLLAAELGWPQLLLARALTVSDGTATVDRELDGATEHLTAPLPAVVSVTDHIAAPRYPAFTSILAARTKPVEVLALADVGLTASDVGEPAARTRVTSARPRPPRPPATVHVDAGDGGTVLAEFLISRGFAGAPSATRTAR